MENSLILWKGALTHKLAQESAIVAQERFFILGEVQISRYGVIGMVVVDTRPQKRMISYTDWEWTGVECDTRPWVYEGDPFRRHHYVDTERGCSIIRIFALPPTISKIFELDAFLGDPVINKCCCDKVFDAEFDEVPSGTISDPVNQLGGITSTVFPIAWKEAGLVDMNPEAFFDQRFWLSFHGLFAFSQAGRQAETAVTRALLNFDSFLERFSKDVAPYQPLQKEITA